MILVLGSSFMINEQIRRIRKMFESYSSFSLAESGIEIASYYHLVQENLPFSNFTVSSKNMGSGEAKNIYPCNEFFVSDEYVDCNETKIIMNEINGERNISILTHAVVKIGITTDILSTRIISNGTFRNTSRILIFNFFSK